MDLEWWADGDAWHGSPWLRIPEEERALDQDLLSRQVEDLHTVIGPSWRVGHALYTLVYRDAATGRHSLYALRPSGDLQCLVTDVRPERIDAAWLQLTSPHAPQEPLAQLEFEQLVSAEPTIRWSPPAGRDEIERRRYQDAQRIARWARARGLAQMGATPPAENMPDGVRREPSPQGLEQRWAAVGGRPPADALAPSDDDTLEEWFDARPPTERGSLGPQGHHCVTPECGTMDPGMARPHRHRLMPDLLAQLQWARWSMWQATQRVKALTAPVDVLVWDAVHAQGPQAQAVTRGAERMRRACEAQRQAETVAGRRAEAAGAAERHGQSAIRMETDASRPWWSHLARRSWPPAARRHLQACAQWERQMERLFLGEAARFAGQADTYTATARRLAPHTADPVGEWAQMEAELPRLLQEAAAHDCRSVPERTRRLHQEAKAADRLRTWHWSALWHLEHELRARAHLDNATSPLASGKPVAGNALETHLRREPPIPPPGPAGADDT